MPVARAVRLVPESSGKLFEQDPASIPAYPKGECLLVRICDEVFEAIEQDGDCHSGAGCASVDQNFVSHKILISLGEQRGLG